MDKFFLLLISLFIFSGCDRGAKDLAQSEENYGSILKTGINSDNVEAALRFAVFLKSVAVTFPSKDSGKRSAKLLAQLEQSAKSEKTRVQSAFEKFKDETTPLLFDIENKLKPISTKERTKKFDLYLPIKKGECLAQDKSSELDKRALAIHTLDIFRIKEIGINDVLIETIFDGNLTELLAYPLREAQKEFKEKIIAKINAQGLIKADCSLAKTLMEKYREIGRMGANLGNVDNYLMQLDLVLDSVTEKK